MLAYTQKVLAAMRDAEDMVARFRGLRTGVLDVAMVSTAKYFLPRLLALFRDEHPGVEVRLQVGNNREEVVGTHARGCGRARDHGTAAAQLALARRALCDAPALPGHLHRASVRARREGARRVPS